MKGGTWYRKRRAGDERVSALLREGEGLESVVLVNEDVERLVRRAAKWPPCEAWAVRMSECVGDHVEV
jgi:hypothetical protein